MLALLQRVPRNAAMLVFLLAMIVVSPAIGTRGSGVIVELVFDMILISGVRSAGPSKHRWLFYGLTTVTLAVRWGQILAGVPELGVSALALTVVWLVAAISIIVTRLFQRRDVTIDTILGAVVTYLLAAVAFTLLFEIIALQDPRAFSGLPEAAANNRGELASSLMYFSLVCITTMGYGDIVPISNIARPLSVLEGVFGQLYLAVTIARLVGLHIAKSHRADD